MGRNQVRLPGMEELCEAETGKHLTMRPKRTITVGLIAVVLAGLAVVWLLPRTPKITEEQFDKIQVGMTLAEVEAVLGCRPGNHTCHHAVPNIDTNQREQDFKEWAADTREPRHPDAIGSQGHEAVVVKVWFDTNGRVMDKRSMGYAYTYNPSFIVYQFRRLLRKIAPKAL
jgi:hypothetical protein